MGGGTMRRTLKTLATAAGALLLGLGSVGCSTWQPDAEMLGAVRTGEYGQARTVIQRKIEKSDAKQTEARENRNFVLDRVRYGMIDLADGQWYAAETPFLAAYDILRTQGVNDDNTVNTFLGTEEGQRYWKGDPFEQAAAYAYLSAQLAAVEDWDNANAAAQNSLFLLRDFGEVEGKDGEKRKKTIEEIYAEAEAKEVEAKNENGEDAGEEAFEEYVDKGYQPVETNFAPGYFMAGVANWGRGRISRDYEDQARDNFRKAVEYAPALRGVVDAIQKGNANTIFWVDYGKGPEKYRTGYREVFSEYRAATASSQEVLEVKVGGSASAQALPAADYNLYATDHRWRSNQELRVVKAALGDALILSGAVVAAEADEGEWGQLAVGLGMMLAGAAVSESAKADIRHNELLPQRTYFAAVNIEQPNTTVDLGVLGKPATRLVLPGVDPPARDERIQFKYVRLNDTPVAPTWAVSGRIAYANDHTGVPRGMSNADMKPFIMGGRCVRAPSAEVLSQYQAAGHLEGYRLVDLENLYRDEGLTWDLSEQKGVSTTHVLEGGTSLVPPEPGSAGFARLFCGEHTPYEPKSDTLRRELGLPPLAQGG
jgi:hypothetical protein